MHKPLKTKGGYVSILFTNKRLDSEEHVLCGVPMSRRLIAVHGTGVSLVISSPETPFA